MKLILFTIKREIYQLKLTIINYAMKFKLILNLIFLLKLSNNIYIWIILFEHKYSQNQYMVYNTKIWRLVLTKFG